MGQILIILIPLVLIVFWAWMFQDMYYRSLLPRCFVSFSGGQDVRKDWFIAFIALNIFTAGYYYLTIFRTAKL